MRIARGLLFREFVADADGRADLYNVNTDTNDNPDAEAKDGRRGMGAIAPAPDKKPAARAAG